MKENLQSYNSSRYSISEKNKIIMQMVVDGFTSKEIADKTWLRTIEGRILKLMKEFNCKNKTHLAITLLRENIIK
jgi:DNA-binding NarL/FixJ family response regulator